MRDIVSRGKCPDDVSDLFLNGDPAGRVGINLTDQHREYLLSKGPQNSMLDSYPVNPSIPALKQNCFTKSWYNINPFIEYSRNLDKIFCVACFLFGSKIGCSENMWQNEGLNRWDKMKGRGTKKKIKIHFTSSAHKQSIQKYHSFPNKSLNVNVKINEQQKKEVALEEEERLCNRKIIHVLLDCCRYLCRQCLAFRRSKDEFKGNFNQLVHLLARWVPIIEYWFRSAT